MQIVEKEAIHEAIRAMQRDSGLSQGDFGAQMGLSRPTMSNIINGNVPPSRVVCDFLGIDLVYRIGKLPSSRKAKPTP